MKLDEFYFIRFFFSGPGFSSRSQARIVWVHHLGQPTLRYFRFDPLRRVLCGVSFATRPALSIVLKDRCTIGVRVPSARGLVLLALLFWLS
jgi:hypothetical protein